jgi:hypothetical protein
VSWGIAIPACLCATFTLHRKANNLNPLRHKTFCLIRGPLGEAAKSLEPWIGFGTSRVCWLVSGAAPEFKGLEPTFENGNKVRQCDFVGLVRD